MDRLRTSSCENLGTAGVRPSSSSTRPSPPRTPAASASAPEGAPPFRPAHTPTPTGAPVPLHGAAIEAQARRLLSAVAPPGADIPHVDALVDYIVNHLVHTDWLHGLLDDLVRHGTLDRDLRHILGVLLGLYGAPRYGVTPELEDVVYALQHTDIWHAKLTRHAALAISWPEDAEGRCPISMKCYAEIDCPVIIDTAPQVSVFEAWDLLQWMQVSMQTPGRAGSAQNPLDRAALSMTQLRAVTWIGRPER